MSKPLYDAVACDATRDLDPNRRDLLVSDPDPSVFAPAGHNSVGPTCLDQRLLEQVDEPTRALAPRLQGWREGGRREKGGEGNERPMGGP